MERKKPSDLPQKPLDLGRRSAVSGLTAGAVFEMMRPD
jgi:hypothetical protein